jgi:uncharacterized membrane-anchored protein
VSDTVRDGSVAHTEGSGPVRVWQHRRMRLGTQRRARPEQAAPGVTGTARLDRRTKDLTRRLRPGDIAVLDHVDLDRVSADALVACRVAAVVNAAPSISGRYPTLGPQVLVAAGIPLVDGVGTGVFSRVREGAAVRLDGGALLTADGEVLATGRVQDAASVAEAMAQARHGLANQLEAFAANTMDYVRRERGLLLDGVGMPDLATRLEGRHALVVVRGYDHVRDLAALRHYVRDHRPVLIGVDGGADALLEAGYPPDLVVGDMDSVSDRALTSGAEVVVHAYPDGTAPGLARVRRLGVPAVTIAAAATSEDVALLLADAKGARLIVAVGTHATLLEFLDKGRGGMASTFLTRLRLGGKLVDAKGVSRLSRPHPHRRARLALLVLVAVLLALALGVALGATIATRATAAGPPAPSPAGTVAAAGPLPTPLLPGAAP